MPEDQKEGDFYSKLLLEQETELTNCSKGAKFKYGLNWLLMCPDKSLLTYVNMKKIFMQ